MANYPYQPPLLSLQEILTNDGADDYWASNPYSIANFFEPIVGHTNNSQQEEAQAQPLPVPSTSCASHGYIDPFWTPTENQPPPPPQQQAQSTVDPHKADTDSLTAKLKLEPEPITVDEAHDNQDCFQSLDVFDESFIKDELEEFDDAKVQIIDDENLPTHGDDNSFVLPHDIDIISEEVEAGSGVAATNTNAAIENGVVLPPPPTGIQKPTPGVYLKEVKFDEKKYLEKKNSRKDAIREIDSLIGTLKRYSNNLETFLNVEGEAILERYNAEMLLRELFKFRKIKEERTTNPFQLAHSITMAVRNSVDDRNVLSTLYPRRAHLWRTSELLLFKKSILKSAIARKEFLLDCRYTELLMEMGFDLDDMTRLRSNPSLEMELGTLRIIMHEHSYFSKMSHSTKKPIRTVVVRDSFPGKVPRVMIFPSPETLVRDRWKALAKIKRETTLSTLKEEEIDWLYVLKQLSIKNTKLYVNEDICRRTYDHLINFKYNNSAWNVEELRRLQHLRQKHNAISWAKIADLLGTNRTPFSCFVKYRAYFADKTNTMNQLLGSEYAIRRLTSCFSECKGNLARLDYELTKRVPDIYKKVKFNGLLVLFQRTLNPKLKKGQFSVAEDALMLVAMEKYKNITLESERSFDAVAYALPWRSFSLWRIRFQRLLTGFYFKSWTIDSDKHLLSLVEEYGPDYKLIQRSFPGKDRKQCRARYIKLLKMRESMTLEEYHTIYSSRNAELRLKRLNQVAEYLDITIRSKRIGGTRYVREQDLDFLRQRRIPRSNKELDSYLMTFPVPIMIAALNSIADCLLNVGEKFKRYTSSGDPNFLLGKGVHPMNNFDRRKFDPLCPASVASALQRRKAKLIPQDVLMDLTPFEEAVYKHYKYFFLVGRTKFRSYAPSIPPLDVLRKLTTVSRLIEKPSGREFSVIVPTKSETAEEKMKEETSALQKFQNRGIHKGTKKKKTLTREARRRAARTRWEKRNVFYGGNDDHFSSSVNSPWSECDLLTMSSAPPTPSSSVFSMGEISECDGDSVAASGSEYGLCLRSRIIGMLSDHSYVSSSSYATPCYLNTLTYPQLQVFTEVAYQNQAPPKPPETETQMQEDEDT